MSWIFQLLRLLPRPTRRHEYWLKIPLGVWRGKQWHLERLEETVGWHYWYLLVTLDSPVRGMTGWRLMWQRKGSPLTRTVQFL